MGLAVSLGKREVSSLSTDEAGGREHEGKSFHVVAITGRGQGISSYRRLEEWKPLREIDYDNYGKYNNCQPELFISVTF
jgi:hypothetical protein